MGKAVKAKLGEEDKKVLNVFMEKGFCCFLKICSSNFVGTTVADYLSKR